MDFSASHRVWRPDWDLQQNQAVFGPRASSAGHGHNYVLEVTLSGALDEETGMVMNLTHLKDIMDQEIGSRFDHRNLNEDTSGFQGGLPTAENLALLVFDLLDAALPDALLHRVRLRPVDDLWVEVSR
jgi:6-pyruvoyltetrahydropterin/6-carboxytetrahydropterin synthase